MVDETNERSVAQILEEVDDPQLREVLQKSPEARQAIYKSMQYVLDSSAMSAARRLMTSADVPDAIKRDMVIGWLAHRRNDREIEHRLSGGGAAGNAITFTFNMNGQEGDNVKRVREAFGVAEAEDAVVSDDE